MMDESYYELESSYRKKGLKTFRIPVGGSDETGLWGYIKCAEELAIDFSTSGFHPEAIICATGSGGTLGGLILGNEIHQLETEVFGVNVCDDRRYFEDKIKTDFDLWTRKYKYLEEKPSLPINIIEGYVGQGYGKATPPVFETIREVAQLEGILLDPVYTAKAFHGMISEINNGCLASFQNILFVHTGGIFGIFPQRKGFFKL
jgi:D-cysteine desulfhydrase